MHPDHPSRADTSRSCLAPEARSISAVINGQLLLFENLVAMNIGDRRFRSRDQIQLSELFFIVSFGDTIILVPEFCELAHSLQTLRTDYKRRGNFGVTILVRMQIQQELDQGPFQSSAPICIEKKTAP